VTFPKNLNNFKPLMRGDSQFLPPGGSMGFRYDLQLLFGDKSNANNSTSTKAREKINTYLKSLEF